MKKLIVALILVFFCTDLPAQTNNQVSSETMAKKERQKELFLYAGIGIVALIVTGILAFRLNKAKDQEQNFTPTIKKIFPNPSGGPLTIQIDGIATQLKISNMEGEVIIAFAIAGNEIHFDFSSWSRGTYTVVAHYGGIQSNAIQLTLI